jgi:hypothetical protein
MPWARQNCAMGNPDAFLLKQLIDVRVFVVFVAPASRGQGKLAGWPQVWVRDEHGVWDQLRFGRQHRAHQLLCLLAWRHGNVRESTVDLYFGQVPNDDGQVVNEPKRNAAKTARRTLEGRLAERHVGHLFHVPGASEDIARQSDAVQSGSKQSDGAGWAVHAAISDVELAAIAVKQGEWEAASLLTDGADGCLIGFASLPRGRREPFWVRMRPSDRDAARVRLPRDLLAVAKGVAEAVRGSAVRAHQEPPKRPEWIKAMLEWLSEPAQQVAPAADTSQPPPIEVEHEDEVIVDAEIVEPHDLPAATGDDERTARDSRLLPVPAASRELDAPARDSATKELIARSPIPDAKPATLGQLRTETTLPVAGGELVVPVHPLNDRAGPARGRVALLGALVAALTIAIVVVANVRPSSRGVQGLTGQHARLEQESPAHSVKTFQNPRDLTAHWTQIPANRVVLVSCRTFVPSVSSNTGGYWYQLLSAPWRGRFAPADTFLNGDPGAAYSEPNAPTVKNPHNFDTAVPVCSSNEAGGSIEIPRTLPTPTFGDPSRGTPAGPAIKQGNRVIVSCKLASDTPTAQPGGFVYRISSAPWNDHYYAPSPAFRNTVPANSSDLQLNDVDVPSCPT